MKVPTLRCVTARCPTSQKVWDDTSLPLSVVYTPLINRETSPRPLGYLPKCPHCGAPLTSLQPSLICHLCLSIFDEGRVLPDDHSFFELPLKMPKVKDMPTQDCPLLWYIAIDGNAVDHSFYTNCANILSKILSEAPQSCVHVALFLVQVGKVGTFQLSSPLPHVIFQKEPSVSLASLQLHNGSIQAALRSLHDYVIPFESPSSSKPKDDAWQILLQEIISDVAQRNPIGRDYGNSNEQLYTGAKITLLRGQEGRSNVRAGGIDTEHITSSVSEDVYQPSETLLALGGDCAQLAVGVDVIAVAPEQKRGDSLWAADLAPLAWRSGAASPVVCSMRHLAAELESRVPWKQSFSAEMRLRATQMSVEEDPNVKVFWYSKGLSGQAVASEQASQLWKLGCCDEHTTLAFDLKLNGKELQTTVFTGTEEIVVRPCVQACLAYTTVEEKDGQWFTVRRMRVSNLNLPFSSTPERIYNHLDPEALAMVLFQKLAIEAFQEDISGTIEIAEEWLQSLLICVYASAEEQVALQKEREEKGLPPTQGFYAQERLLDNGGELNFEDILLAQGHERLCTVPLMVFLLLQSDPLWNNCPPPSGDRVLAFLQLSSSPLNNFARSIAPRLQLWPSNDNGEPILEVMDLRMRDLERTVAEHEGPNLIFIDSPSKIVVMIAIFASEYAEDESVEIKLGNGLRDAISAALESYRTPPSLYKFIRESDRERAVSALLSVLKEDAALTAEGPENFGVWKAKVASLVQKFGLQSTALKAEPIKWSPPSGEKWDEKNFETEIKKLEKEAEERMEAKIAEMMSKIETTGSK